MTEARYVHEGTSLLFPTPLLSYRIADAERINGLLLGEIEARRQNDPGVQRSNRSGWHSESDFFSRTEPGHAALSLAIRGAVADATMQIAGNGARGEKLNYRIVGWINVNPQNAYNVPHEHPGSFWSGSYYVVNDAASPDLEAGGEISFLDARSPPAGQPLIKAPMLAGTHSVRPMPGTLLLFPSSAKHWVHPNSAETNRVSIAFNVFITRQRQPDLRPQMN
jgi:uncharacterized protein (TIGR02466 family)